jgi:hypothetical protein
MTMDDWLLELPAVTRTYGKCLKKVGTSQRELRRLSKKNPKKALKVKQQVVGCIIEKHPFVRGPRQWAQIEIKDARKS